MSGRLVLYSDQLVPDTEPIDQALRSMLPASGARIGHLPSSPDPGRIWFRSQVAYYSRYGYDVVFFGLEDEFDPNRLSELFACDAIHLTGGNTYRFLYWLRRRNLIAPLIEYVAKGGVLVGVSAGAILATPKIDTSSLCGDVPYPGLTDTNGLGLVDFGIFPHFDGSPEHWQSLVEYRRSGPMPVLGVPDGSGIVVDGDKTQYFGEIF